MSGMCKGCLQTKKLIKAHIIPKSFFTNLRANEENLVVLTNSPQTPPKKSPVGIYDPNILCHDCEQNFQSLDNYAYETLLKQENVEEIYENNKFVGQLYTNEHPEKLDLFVVSLLWRASVSNHEFYKKIQLGSLEETAKSLLFSGTNIQKNPFSFVVAKYENSQNQNTITSPYPMRLNKIRHYRFPLGKHIIYIKADSQKEPIDLKSPPNKLIILNGDLLPVEHEIKKLKSIALKNKENWPGAFRKFT